MPIFGYSKHRPNTPVKASLLKEKQFTVAERYLARITDLPPAPVVATELLDLFGDPNTDIVRVVETIRHDPSLTAKLLRMCNSAFYAGEEPATDMFEVVTRLGFYQVYTAVAAMVASSVMSKGKNRGGVDIDKLWRHSVSCAVAASRLVKRVGEPDAEAFTAGLLHDIGKLVFTVVDGIKYGGLVKMVETSGGSLSEAEEAVLGVDHATVGAELLVRWGLPERISNAVAGHNDPSVFGEPSGRLAAIIHVANCLARLLEAHAAIPKEVPEENACALSALGLALADVPTLLAQISRELERVEGLSNACFDAGI